MAVTESIRKAVAWAKSFLDRHPLFAVAAGVVGCVIAADSAWLLGAAAAVIFGGAGRISGSWRRAAAWFLCGAVGVTVFGVRSAHRQNAERGLVGTSGSAAARVLGDARGGRFQWVAQSRLTSGPWKGTKVQWEGAGHPPVAGAIVTGRGDFLKLQGPRNPKEFDRAAWLRRKGIVATFRAETIRVKTDRFAAIGAEIRHGFRAAVTAGLEENSRQAKVIRAIVIGENPPDADEVIAAFRNSGTLHIFSVSGLHVAMVGSIGWFVLRKLGMSRRRAVLAILPLVFGYSWITGNSAPAVRSAWMMAVFLMAFVFRRRPDLLNALGAVLLAAMLWDGNLLFQPGVQLSYGVVAAMAIGVSWARRAFAWIGRKEEYLPDDLVVGWRAWWLTLRRKLAGYLGVSTAAFVGSTPLTIFHFGTVTPIALLANGVLGVLVYGLMIAALLSVAIHPVAPAAAGFINRLNGNLADSCVGAAAWFAAIPGSHFRTRSPEKPMLLIYDLEHGAGAACFTGKGDGAVLLDCGDRNAFRFQIVRSLRGLGIEPDSAVFSHPDGAHLGGGSDVWQAFPIRQALLPVDLSRSPDFQKWRTDAPKAGVKILRACDFDSVPLPAGARLEILLAPDPIAKNLPADDRVAIFRLLWQGWKLLLTSDSGIKTETALLKSGKDISADVIVAGKHQGGVSLSDEFLDAVNPQAIVASHAEFPKQERLDPKHVDYWKSRGIRVANQGVTGGVTIHIDKNGDLLLEGCVDRSVIRLKRR